MTILSEGEIGKRTITPRQRRNNRLDVLQHQHAWRQGPGLGEDVPNMVCVGRVSDVEGGDWVFTAVEEESMHQGFDGDGFAIAWRAVEPRLNVRTRWQTVCCFLERT
jgi:hypothetical protein